MSTVLPPGMGKDSA